MDMNYNFQDRIDEYLLYGDTMSEEDKAQFLKEIEGDAEKKEQYKFTKNVKQAMVSRGEKLKAMTEFQKEMKSHHHRKTWLWDFKHSCCIGCWFLCHQSSVCRKLPYRQCAWG